MKIIAEITPVPLERMADQPYSGKRFLPKKSREFREELQWLMRKEYREAPLTAPLSVTLHFFKPVGTTVKNQYGDIDNLAKAVLDAGNGILWADDSQIVELHGYKNKGEGKIVIEVLECEC